MTVPRQMTSHGPDQPLDELLEGFDAQGDRTQFTALAEGDISCGRCGTHFPANNQPADQLVRLEGSSDPGDMTMVVAVACPTCGAAGPLVLRYGPEASESDAAVLLAMPRDPAAAGHPTSEGREV